MPDAGISASGILRYSSKPSSAIPSINLDSLPLEIPIDDFGITPLDGQKLFSPVDQSIIMPVSYGGKAGRHIYLGNNTYVTPKVPTLYTVLTTGSDAWNPEIYGAGANAYIIKSGQIVQIVVENHDAIEHPMHLHGYDFQVVARGPGIWDGDESKLPAVPLRRDTVTTPPAGHLVIRIKTNNPGTWMFHCHMEFHGKFLVLQKRDTC
jgi:iron transport multicopper oxidase